jgi:hypothetical protein
MSYTHWTDWQVWLLDKDRKPIALLHDAEDFTLTIGAYGQGDFSFKIDPDCSHAALVAVAATEERYLFIVRKTKTVGGIILRVLKPYGPGKKMEVQGRTVNAIMDFAIMQPSAGTPSVTVTGKVDDVMKQHVRLQCVVGTAYNDPSGTARGYPGFAVAANTTQHPDTITLARSESQLGDEIYLYGAHYQVDYDTVPTWNPEGCTWTFTTWYLGRGTDKSFINTAGNVPVVLGETYNVVKEAEWYVDLFNYKNAGYTSGASAVATTDKGDYLRREVVFNASSVTTASVAMADTPRTYGYTFKFMESAGIQCGRDFWIYDKLTYFNKYLNQAAVHDYLSQITFTIQPDGSEEIELLFGLERPELNSAGDKRGGGRQKKTNEPLLTNPFGLEDTDQDTAYPDYTDNHIKLLEGNFIDVNTELPNSIRFSGVPGSPVSVGTSNQEGDAITLARSNHVHAGNTISHTHGLAYTSTDTDGENSAHTHGVGTSGATSGTGGHSHGISDSSTNSGTESTHAHDIGYASTDSGNDVGNHTHYYNYQCYNTEIPNNTDVANYSTHTHAFHYGAGGTNTTATGIQLQAHHHHYNAADAATGSGAEHYHTYYRVSTPTSAESPAHSHSYNAPSSTNSNSGHHHHYDKANTPTGGPS